MNKTIKKYFSLLLLLSLFIASGCKRESGSTSLVDFPFDLLKEGDLVFRCGTGITSRVVLTADKGGYYSHVGVVVKYENCWKVVHAVPGESDSAGDPDKVKLDDIVVFFDQSRATKGALMRLSVDSATCRRAALHAVDLFRSNTLFDHHYNLNDTTRMYCTELIDHVYTHQGIDLREGRISRINIPGLSGDYILPSDIQQSTLLHMIYFF